MRLNNQIRIIYCILAAIVTVLSIVGMVVTNISKSDDVQIIEYSKSENTDSDTICYLFDNLPEFKAGDSLIFYTNHQRVKVSADGNTIYSIDAKTTIFGNSPGSSVNIIALPEHVDELKVEISAVYKSVRDRQYTFYVGDGKEYMRRNMAQGLNSTLLSLVSVIIGCGLMIYWLLLHKRINDEPTVFYFGTCTMLVGLWCLNETDLFLTVLDNHGMSSYISYTLLMLMPVPFVHFYRKFLQIGERIICQIISILSLMNIAISTILHLTGLVYFKESVTATHILLVLAVGYVFYCLLRYAIAFGVNRFWTINIVALSVILISYLMDMMSYYWGSQQTDVVGKIGILIYVVLLGIENLHNFTQKLENGKKAELYRDMAEHDILTGLYNRSAYEDWEQNTTDFKDTMIIMLDLNDLKYCNDTFGHQAGDRYIQSAADIITDCFGEVGKCYRLGGDEFAIIIPRSRGLNIESYIHQMLVKETIENRTLRGRKIEMAYGYAVYNENDENFGNTYKRADAAMYEKKAAMKNGRVR